MATSMNVSVTASDPEAMVTRLAQALATALALRALLLVASKYSLKLMIWYMRWVAFGLHASYVALIFLGC